MLGQSPRRGHGAIGGDAHAFEEEVEPRLPVALAAHAVEQVVVGRAVPLQVEAEVEERLVQYRRATEHQRDEQPADATVAVEERVDGLELHVRESRTHKDRQAIAVRVEEALQVGHAVLDRRVRRRDETGVPGPRAADPVLRAPELARGAAAPAAPRQQHAVDLAYQPVGEREPRSQSGKPVVESGDVVGDLRDVADGRAGQFLQLEEQEVRQRRLRPLDLRGQHRFLADVRVQEERRVWQQRRDPVEATDREHGCLEGLLPPGAEVERRDRRERGGHEGADRLPAHGARFVPAGFATVRHGPPPG